MEMAVEEHLEELRRRLFVFILTLFLALLVLFPMSGPVFKRMQEDLIITGDGTAVQVIATSLTESIVARVKIATYSALLFVLPTVGFYQAFSFINPGLRARERRIVFATVVPVFVMFAAGAVFAYKVLLPVMISFLVGFTLDMGVQPYLAVDTTISFIFATMLLMGFMFELPVMCALLSWLGVLPPSLLTYYRRHIYLIIFIVAGVVTPDPTFVSQFVLAIPMVILFEMGVVVARLMWRGE
ncbi:MAG: twin-arginine translocase subunit TatC [Candidatus Undinarchaeales archaeon]|jgi:sec-independent protein translocase protein TatC|nr:twin-arginine translocase subunit TatC [Candidatus Undinarchaeales archaeon]MDP7494680.1 twin-arginine translocase subunit TatC [Candidatus Undinarchaeales archaeon]